MTNFSRQWVKLEAVESITSHPRQDINSPSRTDLHWLSELRWAERGPFRWYSAAVDHPSDSHQPPPRPPSFRPTGFSISRPEIRRASVDWEECKEHRHRWCKLCRRTAVNIRQAQPAGRSSESACLRQGLAVPGLCFFFSPLFTLFCWEIMFWKVSG